jgi:hypothetical protein
VQALDTQRDGLEVREEATEPAMVHVRLAGRLGDVLDAVARLLLGADEQHGAAAVGDLGREALGLRQQLLGLEQVDDVDPAALAVDEAAHLRVPAARLVAEVHAGLQQLPDSYLSHENSLVCMCSAARAIEARGPGVLCRAGPRASGRIGRPPGVDL